MNANCLRCRRQFTARPSERRIGRDKYCSVPCRLPSVSERFWSRVDKAGANDCWLWTGGTVGRIGYGAFSIDNRSTSTHRVAWELTYGPIPDGYHVLHRCDVRLCVNPDHLFLGTNADNMADRNAKGRCAHGPSHSAAILNGLQHKRAISLNRSLGLPLPRWDDTYEDLS